MRWTNPALHAAHSARTHKHTHPFALALALSSRCCSPLLYSLLYSLTQARACLPYFTSFAHHTFFTLSLSHTVSVHLCLALQSSVLPWLPLSPPLPLPLPLLSSSSPLSSLLSSLLSPLLS